ncbi:MAG: MarR family transcriptional regulator [Armatimonadetes bacterium]|nr:MarR family transcriptional regulator [Armatimonadota bacterium]NIM24540.1 MarR family transcriptional regulator [Armatimonadota bacterium]NIM68414.1 MarR family transcriptional regulator [Armatimonadota bacterium]NIM76800.1 MarR family transcriptional regulator [Armatimonadota bacterium]NIN06613.1 MarR family transcriptional regulator [Armatimonadota bacterium]
MAAARKLTQGTEEYVEAIWRVAESGEATIKDLARHLGVAPPSVTGMMKRLASMGLVKYSPYGKVSLSAKGRRLAAAVIRRHRLSERMLTDMLGLPWEKAHEEACRFEHLITGEVEERVAERLGEIDTCPHGHPIDISAADKSIPLTEAKPSSRARVAAVGDESPEVLQYLSKVGIVPGARLKVVGQEPVADGPMLLEVAGKPRALGRQTAEKIRIILESEAKAR